MTARKPLLLLATALLVACGSDPSFDFDAIVIDAASDAAGDSASTDADAAESDTPDQSDATGEDTAVDVGDDADAPDPDAPDADSDAPDTGPERGAIGAPCTRNSDCTSSVCIPVGGGVTVCSHACDLGCPAGWTCDDGDVVCGCEASAEICDGIDNDCDAQVDEGIGAELGCAGAERCLDGLCVCPDGATQCDGVCTDTDVDVLNCGGCGTACGVGEACIDADCVCPDGSDVCDGVCIDTSEDVTNCGGCGITCPDGLACVDSECDCPGATEAFCFDTCVDVSGDIDNCGDCGIRCRRTEVCEAGACTCPEGWGRCAGGLCIDIRTDPNNCGGCGVACGAGRVCVDSECRCPEGLTLCGGTCVDLLVDETHCGRCDRACTGEDVCAAGECGCPAGLIGCGGGCIDGSSDPNNCGGCDIACTGTDICVDSECTCPCGGTSCDDGTCLVLPRSAPAEAVNMTFVPDTEQQADIAILMDTTGSMGGEIATLRTTILTNVVPAARAGFANAGVAIAAFDDFPCGSFGTALDHPFTLYQRVTTDDLAIQAGTDSLALHSGGDQPESGWEGLYQLATGAGRVVTCVGGSSVPAFDPGAGYVEGVADGAIGGVGFREGSLPIVVHITDAPSQERGVNSYPYGATSAEAIAALQAIGARVIGVRSDTSATYLTVAAHQTGATVPPCAWDGARPAGCGAGLCCTGTSGVGVAPGADGNCDLVFSISGTGSGLETSISSALRVLARFTSFTVSLDVRRDEAVWEATGIDTSCLVTSYRATSAGAPPDTCVGETTRVDLDLDGVEDGFENAFAGVSLDYRVQVRNLCVATPGLYPVHLDVRAGSAIFDTRTLWVYVP